MRRVVAATFILFVIVQRDKRKERERGSQPLSFLLQSLQSLKKCYNRFSKFVAKVRKSRNFTKVV